MDIWRVMALVSLSFIDVAYAVASPPIPYTREALPGYYGTLAMELLYTPAWA